MSRSRSASDDAPPPYNSLHPLQGITTIAPPGDAPAARSDETVQSSNSQLVKAGAPSIPNEVIREFAGQITYHVPSSSDEIFPDIYNFNGHLIVHISGPLAPGQAVPNICNFNGWLELHCTGPAPPLWAYSNIENFNGLTCVYNSGRPADSQPLLLSSDIANFGQDYHPALSSYGTMAALPRASPRVIACECPELFRPSIWLNSNAILFIMIILQVLLLIIQYLTGSVEGSFCSFRLSVLLAVELVIGIIHLLWQVCSGALEPQEGLLDFTFADTFLIEVGLVGLITVGNRWTAGVHFSG